MVLHILPWDQEAGILQTSTPSYSSIVPGPPYPSLRPGSWWLYSTPVSGPIALLSMVLYILPWDQAAGVLFTYKQSYSSIVPGPPYPSLRRSSWRLYSTPVSGPIALLSMVLHILSWDQEAGTLYPSKRSYCSIVHGPPYPSLRPDSWYSTLYPSKRSYSSIVHGPPYLSLRPGSW